MHPHKLSGPPRTLGSGHRRFHSQPQYALLLLTFVLAGCLPFSCSKKENRELFPADSLSRALAASIPVDTLEIVDQLRPDSPFLSYPSSLVYAPDGRLWVGDLLTHVMTGFEESGRVSSSLQFEEVKYPYISGFRGDTLVVFTPEDPRILQIVNEEIVRTIHLPQDTPVDSGNRYVTSFEGGYFYKVIDKEFSGYIARLNNAGQETARWDLPGKYWRYAGALRMWSDSLLSLSGYLPQVHVLTPGARAAALGAVAAALGAPAGTVEGDAAPGVIDETVATTTDETVAETIAGTSSGPGLDSLTLRGFDSPMLSRTRLFTLDELTQPPLLSSSAVAVGERLFVLNMRPGWLRVDVYDRSGELQYILTQPDPQFNTDYFPTDLAVRIAIKGDGANASGSGTVYELAVSVYKPEPRIDRFLWRE